MLDKVKKHLELRLPFVLYLLPNQNKLYGLFQKDDFIYDFKGQSGFVFVSFDDEKHIIPSEGSDFMEEEFSFDSANQTEVLINYSENEKKHFEDIVQKALNSIQNGNFEKVVLSRKIEIEKKIELIETFSRLANRYPTAFRYLFFHPKIGCWMGATPEQLIKVENNHFETVSLAGTHQKNSFEKWSSKEIQEQQIVTDYILDNLHKEVLSVKVSEPFTVEAGSLVHLKTIISGEVHSIENTKNIIQNLHPTPAVCGFPKEKALQFISENENYDRKFYAGYLGLWNEEEASANLFVNLRCLEVEENKINIYVGCGITGESNPENEFFETEHKSQIMKSIL
ncbi:chorismate-binding protein [Flavobacterium azooxidireducens]|uniref:isochorismate synthase n=1 Tax=Flavobacterium azooxidireducens TaxID=1871076 RepID=A0ABY4KCF4_9FLAO|nr:chorismate-binding protein [Flavobacterium azooxidireducens]UPQ78467.1 chorismate-binding protein [Flavobacterium azooxidireducens]